MTPLTVEEFDRVFHSLGRAPTWVTLTGGEPFLRKDLPEIAVALSERCRPSFVTLATNGSLPVRTVEAVEQIARRGSRTHWVVNLSLDDIGERHDEIRQHKGSWQAANETLRGLRELAAPNVTVGIHTCISAFNAARFPEIQRELLKLEPDSYIAEMAEERGELLNADDEIEPADDDYRSAVDALIGRFRADGPSSRATRIVRALRLRYYALSREYLGHRQQMVPCMAGWTFAHIGADGEVWTCSTRAEPIGRLREVDYDFRKIWKSDSAARLRDSIRRRDCACPMVSTAYVSMLSDWKSLTRIGWDLVGLRAGAGEKTS